MHAGAGGKVATFNVAKAGAITSMPAQFSGLQNNAGDCVAIYSPNGGGYGDPHEPTPAQVREDVLDDCCTKAYAFEAHGVVPTDQLEINVVATAARRDAQPRRVKNQIPAASPAAI